MFYERLLDAIQDLTIVEVFYYYLQAGESTVAKTELTQRKV